MSQDMCKSAPHAHAVRTTVLDQRKSVVAKFLFLRSSASPLLQNHVAHKLLEACGNCDSFLQGSALARDLLAPLRRCSPAPPL